MEQSYEHNYFSGMALVKRAGTYELVEMGRVIEDIKACHPNPPPYEYRELLLDETPREFRFIRPDFGEPDVGGKYSESLAAKGTEFFADEKEIFARMGPGICMHVCSCQTNQGAQTAARVMEILRQLIEDLAGERRNPPAPSPQAPLPEPQKPARRRLRVVWDVQELLKFIPEGVHSEQVGRMIAEWLNRILTNKTFQFRPRYRDIVAEFPEDDEYAYIFVQLKADAFAYAYCRGFMDGKAGAPGLGLQ